MNRRVLQTALTVLVALGFIVMIGTSPMYLVEGSVQSGECQVFPQTGRVICGKFRAFWQQYGGVRVFGYPISNEFSEFIEIDDRPELLTVQYFERAVFELHTTEKPPYDVQLRRVGALDYEARYPKGSLEGDLPLYPNAKVLSVESGSTELIRVTTFETSDRPQVILAFYKDGLLKRGWKVSTETTTSIGFDYLPSKSPGTSYGLYVETTSINGGRTRVKLSFEMLPPR